MRELTKGLPPHEEPLRGKTKKVLRFRHANRGCYIELLNDVTAFDDPKFTKSFPDKAQLCNTVLCENFKLLRRHGVPVAFWERWGSQGYLAPYCRMIKLEVVVRLEVAPKSSYIKRHPDTKAGHRFEEPEVELYLKTTDKKLAGREYPCNDPLLEAGETRFEIFYPNRPTKDPSSFIGALDYDELGLTSDMLRTIKHMGVQMGTILSTAWESVGANLLDFKWEPGYLPTRDILVADGVDNDSHRLVYKGKDISKQSFRDGASIDDVHCNYWQAARLSSSLPY
jgi:phosphoribosylaminoimidazole-succinocarboxamide synthase